jgi:hypothetical protein
MSTSFMIWRPICGYDSDLDKIRGDAQEPEDDDLDGILDEEGEEEG